MLPHKKRNQPATPPDITPVRGRRSRPNGSRNKPKEEGASRRSSRKKIKRGVTDTESPVSEKPAEGAVDSDVLEGAEELLALESLSPEHASGFNMPGMSPLLC